MNIALIVASGKGTRINSSLPKQFIKINDKEMICYTVEIFQNCNLIDEIYVVTLNDYLQFTIKLLEPFSKVKLVTSGGETRQDSVRNGINSIKCNGFDNILIHDGDRPFLTENDLVKLIEELKNNDNAVLASRVSNGFPKNTSNAGRKATYDGVFYNIQTPQCFKYDIIKSLHNRLKDKAVIDDALLFDLENRKVNIVEGSINNIKITTDDDLEYFKSR